MDYKLPPRFENSNKSTYGRVLNISGSDYMPGAAYLSSVSALKIGCGYCYLCSTERVIDAVSAQTQNVVFLPLDRIAESIKNLPPDVVELGCGLSQSQEAVGIFKQVLNVCPENLPLIIDADGLNILANNYEFYNEKGFENVVLTPHPKEAARLLGWSLEDVLHNTVAAARAISEKYNCIAVLKTYKTVVTSSDGMLYENTTGNNAMAKAGSGDVLTGMIAGLAAQGMDLFEAAALGVYLHGLSGDLAAKKLTQYSVMAEDLISFIPESIRFYLNNSIS